MINNTPKTQHLRNNPKGMASDWIYFEYQKLELELNTIKKENERLNKRLQSLRRLALDKWD